MRGARAAGILRTVAAAIVVGCGGAPEAVEPAAPPPRCPELETRMVECACRAAGVESLPPSVESGLREAAAVNCRRLRSASRDRELPGRIAEACAGEPCANYASCIGEALASP